MLENNIKMDLKEIMLKCVDCIHLAQDRNQQQALGNTTVSLEVLQEVVNIFYDMHPAVYR
jgi:phage terminase Nu1 subunit (DNA packaging protein)